MKIYAKSILAELLKQSGFDPLDFVEEYRADLYLRKEKHFIEEDIINQLIILCNTSGIIIQQHADTIENIFALLKNASYPLLLFIKENDKHKPIIIKKHDSKHVFTLINFEEHQIVSDENVTEVNLKKLPFVSDEIKNIKYITIYPVLSIDADVNSHLHEPGKSRYKVLGKFFKLLLEERKEIIYIWIYALLSGIITLSLPLGIQSLINFVSSGQAVTSAYILIFFVLIGIFGAGFITIMQLHLVEYIRQRVFVKNTFQYAYIIPKIKLESILKYNPPELINRFFDVVGLQKGLATLLIDFSSALLQIIFGIILLTLYHPFFIIIGIFLILALVSILAFTGPKGLETSINESTYKYKIANWLEEMARALSTFKLAGNTTFAQDKTDALLSKYLYWRNRHFKILVSQYYSFVIFKTLITAILLLLGVYLIVSQLITLGQFIASEIIIILIMNRVSCSYCGKRYIHRDKRIKLPLFRLQ
jgi:ABC-type bacteriocin/lantibiotic exporter with double-glycine peptidase domain